MAGTTDSRGARPRRDRIASVLVQSKKHGDSFRTECRGTRISSRRARSSIRQNALESNGPATEGRGQSAGDGVQAAECRRSWSSRRPGSPLHAANRDRQAAEASIGKTQRSTSLPSAGNQYPGEINIWGNSTSGGNQHRRGTNIRGKPRAAALTWLRDSRGETSTRAGTHAWCHKTGRHLHTGEEDRRHTRPEKPANICTRSRTRPDCPCEASAPSTRRPPICERTWGRRPRAWEELPGRGRLEPPDSRGIGECEDDSNSRRSIGGQGMRRNANACGAHESPTSCVRRTPH
jgi:hypothetical protein